MPFQRGHYSMPTGMLLLPRAPPEPVISFTPSRINARIGNIMPFAILLLQIGVYFLL